MTQILFDMIGAYNRGGLKLPPLINHTPWPWSEEVDAKFLVRNRYKLKVEPSTPPNDARAFWVLPGKSGQVDRLSATAAGRYALGRKLSAMRRQMTAATKVQVVLGGKRHGFAGFLPGIVEEAILTIKSRRPIYVLGGFGGAASVVAQALSGVSPPELSIQYQTEMSATYGETLAFYDQERRRFPELELEAIDYELIVDELRAFGLSGDSAPPTAWMNWRTSFCKRQLTLTRRSI